MVSVVGQLMVQCNGGVDGESPLEGMHNMDGRPGWLVGWFPGRRTGWLDGGGALKQNFVPPSPPPPPTRPITLGAQLNSLRRLPLFFFFFFLFFLFSPSLLPQVNSLCGRVPWEAFRRGGERHECHWVRLSSDCSSAFGVSSKIEVIRK